MLSPDEPVELSRGLSFPHTLETRHANQSTYDPPNSAGIPSFNSPYDSSAAACSRGDPACWTVRWRAFRLMIPSIAGRTRVASDLDSAAYMPWHARSRRGAHLSTTCRHSLARFRRCGVKGAD
jgi:hypothetical protein